MLVVMIAAAAAVQPVAKQMTLGWFDGVVLLALAWGIFKGRRHGMSREFLPLLQWLIIVPLCGFLYSLAGQFYINTMRWTKLTGYVCGYLTLAFVVLLIFSVLRKLFTERLAKSDTFKNTEYYLGMLGGAIRMICILIVLLALLNAPVYTQADIDAHAAYVHKAFGGDQAGFSGDYFPTLQQIQEQVFKKSAAGPWAKDNLGMLFINNTAPAAPNEPALKPKPKAVIQFGNQTISPAVPAPAKPAANPTNK